MTNTEEKSTFAKLIIYEEFEDEQTIHDYFELSTNRILIGSSEDNNLILDVPDVDPTHVSLELRNHHWILQDMGAPSGTTVNNEAIKEPYCLKEADLIEVGHIKMKFQGGNSPPIIKKPSQNKGGVISGRLWFATMAGTTLAVIFIIMFLLIVAHYAGVIDIADLLPF